MEVDVVVLVLFLLLFALASSGNGLITGLHCGIIKWHEIS